MKRTQADSGESCIPSPTNHIVPLIEMRRSVKGMLMNGYKDVNSEITCTPKAVFPVRRRKA